METIESGLVPRRRRLIAFMPLVVILMTSLSCVGALAVDSTAGRVAIVVAILAIGTAFSAGMLIAGREPDSRR